MWDQGTDVHVHKIEITKGRRIKKKQVHPTSAAARGPFAPVPCPSGRVSGPWCGPPAASAGPRARFCVPTALWPRRCRPGLPAVS